MDSFLQSTIRASLEVMYKVASFFLKLWLVPLNAMIEWVNERIKPLVEPFFIFLKDNKTKLLRMSIYSIMAFILIGFISLVNYYIVYSFIVSKASTTEPLFFDFGAKKVTATSEVAVEFQRNKLYDVYLKLVLPESPRNEEMGMFMACLDLDNQDKWNPQKLLHVCRPAVLKYRSPIVKLFRNLLLLGPYFLGMLDEKQTISIPMVENLLSKKFYQSVSVSVNLLNPDIQIYEASLVFQARLSGLEYYLHHYPLMSFAIGFSGIFVFWTSLFAFVVTALLVYRYVNNKQPLAAPAAAKEEDLELIPLPLAPSSFSNEKDDEKKKLYRELDEVFSSSSANLNHKYAWEEDRNINSFIPEPSPSLAPSSSSSDQQHVVPDVTDDSNNNNSAILKGTTTSATPTPDIYDKLETVDPSTSTETPGEEFTHDTTKSMLSLSTSDSGSTIVTSSGDDMNKLHTPHSSDQESYGNSGQLGGEEWQVIGSFDDEVPQTLRKRNV